MLAIAKGPILQTEDSSSLRIQVAVPDGETDFELGIFDGDCTVDGESTRWDLGDTSLFRYTLFADPDGDGTGTTPIEMVPGSTEIFSTEMADNGWSTYFIPTSMEARAASGNYFYYLHVVRVGSEDAMNSFKIRSSGQVMLFPGPFCHIANFSSMADGLLIYPGFPSTTPTTYDGTFDIFFEVPTPATEMVIWDGDFDHYSWDATETDDDDLDTPGEPFLPLWAGAWGPLRNRSIGLLVVSF